MIWTSWSYCKIRSHWAARGWSWDKVWGKDGTRQKSAAELVNKGNGLACEILALGTLMYVQKNLDAICSPPGGSAAEGFQRKNFSLHVFCISLSIFKVFFFFFLWKPFPSVQHYRWGGQTWRCSHQMNSVMQSLRSLCKSSSLNGKYFSFYFEITYIFCWCGNTKSANH